MMSVPSVRLGRGETAIVGYGLLLVPRTVERTVGSDYGGPFIRCGLEGWRRTWGATMPNEAFYFLEDGDRVYPNDIAYLDVARDEHSSLNCVVIVLNEQQLEAMNGREWIYEAVPVSDELQGVHIDGGDALVYRSAEGHRRNLAAGLPDVAIRKSYIDGLDSMLASLDANQRRAFQETTDDPPDHLIVDDALDPDRPNPWAAAGKGFDPNQQTDR